MGALVAIQPCLIHTQAVKECRKHCHRGVLVLGGHGREGMERGHAAKKRVPPDSLRNLLQGKPVLKAQKHSLFCAVHG